MIQREMANTHKQPNIPILVLDRQEAATALRISTRKLDYLIQRGEIAATRVDGRVLVACAELLRFVERKSARTEAEEVCT
jgi:excisionase family DNA binding protein